jgi:DNA-binding response OmpR family regulator
MQDDQLSKNHTRQGGDMDAQAAHILIADDEAPIRLTMESLLQRRGYTVTTAENGIDALELLQHTIFDLLLLDLSMPGLSGLEVAQRAQELQPEAAVIILTGHGSLESAIEGVRLNIFDYLLKTTAPQDVLARIAAAIEQQRNERHKQQLFQRLQVVVQELGGAPDPAPPPQPVASRITVGDLDLSTWNQSAQICGRKLNLTPTEFRILVCLAQHVGHALTYQQIVHFAQGYDANTIEASELLKPHIHHLRQKIETDVTDPQYLLTVRGTGYLLLATPKARREMQVGAGSAE